MRARGMVAGIVIALVGAVWTLQGLGSSLAPQSFMTSNRVWFWIGAATFAAGIGLSRWAWKRR